MFVYIIGVINFCSMTRYANILNDDAFKVVIFTPGNEELVARMLGFFVTFGAIESRESMVVGKVCRTYGQGLC